MDQLRYQQRGALLFYRSAWPFYCSQEYLLPGNAGSTDLCDPETKAENQASNDKEGDVKAYGYHRDSAKHDNAT